MSGTHSQVERTNPRVTGGREALDPREDCEAARADAMFFRSQTLAIVRHFYEIASQIGRLPSILGREFFRAKISHHAIPSFEEQIVFIHDVEHALARLGEQDAEVIALVGLFHCTLDDAADILGRSRRTVVQRYADSIDRLAEIFLETGLLSESRTDRRVTRFHTGVQDAAVLPPKKPAASARTETYHVVGGTDSVTPFRVCGQGA
jgi:hypothetical protein